MRQQRGITQRDLGEGCSLGQALISAYELEKVFPTLDSLEKILSALRADRFALFAALEAVNGRPALAFPISHSGDRTPGHELLDLLEMDGLSPRDEKVFLRLAHECGIGFFSRSKPSKKSLPEPGAREIESFLIFFYFSERESIGLSESYGFPASQFLYPVFLIATFSATHCVFRIFYLSSEGGRKTDALKGILSSGRGSCGMGPLRCSRPEEALPCFAKPLDFWLPSPSVSPFI